MTRRPDVQYAWNDGVALAYQVVGDGPRDLLVLFGYLSNIEWLWRMEPSAAFFDRLADGFRLILMDRRGTGLSDRFASDAAPSLEDTIDDVLAVLDAAGSVRAHVLAFWDGCLPAMMLAATHSDRVASLTLYSASRRGSGDEPYEWGDEEWDQLFAEIRDSWGTRAGTVRRLRYQSPSALATQELADDHVTLLRLAASPSSAIALLQVHRRSDVSAILPAIRVPTLVLHRTGDVTETVEAGREVARRIPGSRFVELDGNDALPWVADTTTISDALEAHIGDGEIPDDPERVLATVLFTDIVDSTATAVALGDARWTKLLADHDDRAREAVARHRGRLVESRGDGLMAVFDGPARAVRCAQSITAAAADLGLGVRAGCHTGEIEIGGGQAQGIAVHVGARIAALGGASDVLVSSTVRDLTAGAGLHFELVGEHELKGVPDRWRVFRVAD
jgi:class 3 adenylate cyclase